MTRVGGMGGLVELLLVGAGGFVGSMSRYALGGWVHRWAPDAQFPWGTLVVNVLGSFLLGGLAGLADGRQLFSPESRLFLFLGLLGGFTTFSTFSYETLLLLRGGEVLPAAGNVVFQVSAGLGAAWLGLVVASGISG